MTVIRNSAEPPIIQEGIDLGRSNPFTYAAASGSVMLEGLEMQSPWTLYDRLRGSLNAHRMRIPLEKMFEHRPEHLSHRLYRTVDLWWVLLKMNNCLSHSDFQGNNVWIYDPSRLDDLVDLAVKTPTGQVEVGSYEDLTLHPL